jgi:hypothetical protein
MKMPALTPFWPPLSPPARRLQKQSHFGNSQILEKSQAA